jgi:C1A family cysteine protease
MLYLAAVASALALTLPLNKEFEAWKATHGKTYASVDEEATALMAWESNDEIIRSTNAKNLSYTLGHNEFSDLTWEQFHRFHMSELFLNTPPKNMMRVHLPNPDVKLDDAVDWVAKGAVTPVKNQGRCGSCWAFSTTGSTEGAYQIASGKLVSLSEQDLVSCDHNGDMGCQGGLMDHAFEWIAQNGIAAEADYPYTSGTGTAAACDATKSAKPVVTMTGHKDVPQGDENALQSAVAMGPVSIAIEADKSVFQLYKSGVLDNPACGTKLDHGVLVVGYGTDTTVSKDYWKVKNSWGETWGEQGYIRMVRGKNQCGIADSASYPTGVKAASPSPPGPGP